METQQKFESLITGDIVKHEIHGKWTVIAPNNEANGVVECRRFVGFRMQLRYFGRCTLRKTRN
jgi:hypothetical protein